LFICELCKLLKYNPYLKIVKRKKAGSGGAAFIVVISINNLLVFVWDLAFGACNFYNFP